MADWNGPADTLTVAVRADTSQFQQQIADASRLGRQFGNQLGTAFDGIAIKGKGMSDTLRSLALSMSQLVLKSALRPLTDSIGSAVAGFLNGGMAFAKGGAGAVCIRRCHREPGHVPAGRWPHGPRGGARRRGDHAADARG